MAKRVVSTVNMRISIGISLGTHCPECGKAFKRSDIEQGRHVSNPECQSMIKSGTRRECAAEAAAWVKRQEEKQCQNRRTRRS